MNSTFLFKMLEFLSLNKRYQIFIKLKPREYLKKSEKKREKKFKCDQCNYAGTEKNKLKLHIRRVHTTSKDFKCDHCDFATSTKDNLRKHKRRKHKVNLDNTEYHDNSKITVFQCEFCDFQTSNGRRALQTHIMIVHTHEKPYKCNLCDFKSVRKPGFF